MSDSATDQLLRQYLEEDRRVWALMNAQIDRASAALGAWQTLGSAGAPLAALPAVQDTQP